MAAQWSDDGCRVNQSDESGKTRHPIRDSRRANPEIVRTAMYHAGTQTRKT